MYMCIYTYIHTHTYTHTHTHTHTYIYLEVGMATHSSILTWRIAMDRGAWQDAVYGVTESDTTDQLSTLRDVLSHSVVSECFATPWTVAHQAPLSMAIS